VGYSGGTKEDPTYYSLGDHSETIQIDYDPAQISYAELLHVFWESHQPEWPSLSRQYASVIFYHNREQKKLGLATREREEAILGVVHTDVLPFSSFYLAEAYHQKWSLQQNSKLKAELDAIYPDVNDLIYSTASAKVNGYLGGHSTLETLREEIDDLGLSLGGREQLWKIVAAKEGISEVCPLPQVE